MSQKRINPYDRLKQEAKKWALKVAYPLRKTMWRYPKADLLRDGGWHLADLWERVAAAEQLGWRVELTASDEGLVVTYVKKHEDAPWEFRP